MWKIAIYTIIFNVFIAITGKREKQIQKVLLNTNNMYNAIKGISGSAIQPIICLELSEQDAEEMEEEE
jgi:hypothetical protein